MQNNAYREKAAGRFRAGARLSMQTIDFQTEPSRYRHWRIERDGDVAYLIMDVDQAGGLFDGYELKLNSYDLGVDIELNDAVQRLRFEHPEVRCVVIKSGKDNVFCAGANIRMLGKSTHAPEGEFLQVHQRDAARHRGRLARIPSRSISAPSTAMPPAAATSWRSPPTTSCWWTTAARRWRCRRRRCSPCCRAPAGSPASPTSAKCGATAPTCSARSRRASAAAKAVEWRLVDEVVPNSKWKDTVAARAHEIAARSDRPKDAKGIALTPLDAQDRGRPRGLFACRRRDRPRARACHRHRARALASRAGLGRSRACARRQVLAAHRGARTGRRHPASARQRAGDRRPAAAHRRQRARRARSRRLPRPRPMATG